MVRFDFFKWCQPSTRLRSDVQVVCSIIAQYGGIVSHGCLSARVYGVLRRRMLALPDCHPLGCLRFGAIDGIYKRLHGALAVLVANGRVHKVRVVRKRAGMHRALAELPVGSASSSYFEGYSVRRGRGWWARCPSWAWRSLKKITASWRTKITRQRRGWMCYGTGLAHAHGCLIPVHII